MKRDGSNPQSGGGQRMCDQCKGPDVMRTDWVEPGRGSTVGELIDFFDPEHMAVIGDKLSFQVGRKTDLYVSPDRGSRLGYLPHSTGIDRPRVIEALKRVGIAIA